jgi:hypothetical protein
VIADAVYFAIAGIGFCHAAGRSIVSRGFRAGMNKLMPKNRIKTARSISEAVFFALIKNS